MSSTQQQQDDNAATTVPEANKGCSWDDYKEEVIAKCIVPFSYETTSYKGSSGRIGIIGGNEFYVGAPYFTGMAALQTGIDLVSIYTAQEAAIPLKCYSPDLMVQSYYCTADLHDSDDENVDINSDSAQEIIQKVIQTMEKCLQQRRYDCYVIGPGMGRHPLVMEIVSQIIQSILLPKNKYIVFDADALYMLSVPRYHHIIQGYTNAILTPNKVEFDRLFHNTSTNQCLQSATIVQKGHVDSIHKSSSLSCKYTCTEMGGMKRCGGIGDVLAGTIATFVAWQSIVQTRQQQQTKQQPLSSSLLINNATIDATSKATIFDDPDPDHENTLSLACYAACCLVKRATKKAFDKKQRAMSAQDVINEIATTFQGMTM